MKKLLIILIISIYPSAFIGQTATLQDTLFFNAEWKICKKGKASFYRIAEPQTGGGYLIKDMYLKTNTPQMIAYSKTIEPTTIEGKCTYYYPNGNKKSEGNYVDDIPKSIWINWSENGKDSTFKDYAHLQKKPNSIKLEPFLYSKEHPFSFALRGKAAMFFIIEDVYFMTWTFGTEFKYKKHSLGIDGTWFRWQYETDTNEDIGMYSEYELRTYLHADYKFTFISFERSELDLYVNAYDKIGKYKMWYDAYEDYDYGTMDMSFLQSTTRGTFNEPGLGFGIRKYAEKTGFGVDVSANVGYRFSDNNERTYISQIETDFKDHAKAERFLFYMRVNAFFTFGQ
ncbi:MAG: hypothetical protein H0W84_07125 [Bacteroidetes bacterium]|nr:hypothetical protein [Bacteroidota bacterium]